MNPHFQNPIFDALYCDEHHFDEEVCDGLISKSPKIEDFDEIREGPLLLGHDLYWEDEEVVSLLSMEQKEGFLNYDDFHSNGSLQMVRNEAINWILKVVAHYGFKPLTAVLAVNYFDRFITSLCFQTEKPWMGQLAAVACLSIAAKVEETQVPLLLDIQVEECKCVFEAKTVQRMELLVLSTLQWRMHPVTPLSFLDHFVRRFEFDSGFLKRCENVLFLILTDCRIIARYLPSVIAAATMMHVIREIDGCDSQEFGNQITGILRTNKDKIGDCKKLITELMDDHDDHKHSHKRKHETIPSSPSGVIDAFFSAESSNDSWAIAPSVSSSPKPLPKRSRGA